MGCYLTRHALHKDFLRSICALWYEAMFLLDEDFNIRQIKPKHATLTNLDLN